MKTLLLSEIFPPRVGGSGRWLWEIYRRLPCEDYVFAVGDDHRQEDFDRTHNLRLMRMPLSFPTWGIASLSGLRQYVRTAWRLRRLVRREGVGALHCGKCLPEGFLAWLLKRWCGIPYLCYVHGEELTLAARSRELAWLTRRVLHGASFVIANSRNTEGLLRDEWDLAAGCVRVLHPGVDTTRFVPAERSAEVRARLGWYDRPVILTVGALQKRKGQDMMIRALPAIRKRFPTILYAIAGEGWEQTYLEQLVADLDLQEHVQFRGVAGDEDLLHYYQQCDLFALPNRQVGWDIEGFGIVLLEAQACGKPVIAGKSGGTAETMLVPHTGVLVSCEGPEEISTILMKLLGDVELLEKMGKTGRDWVLSRFDWQSLSREFLRMIVEMPHRSCPMGTSNGQLVPEDHDRVMSDEFLEDQGS